MKKTIKLMNRLVLLGVFTFLSLSVFGQANATPKKHKIQKMTASERTGSVQTTETTTKVTTTPSQEATAQKKAATAKLAQQKIPSKAELAEKGMRVNKKQELAITQKKATTKPAKSSARALMNELKNVPVNERASFLNKKLETTTNEQERAWLKRALMRCKQQ